MLAALQAKKYLALTSLVLAIVVLAVAAWAAGDDLAPRVQLIPAVEGYPAGEGTPLLLAMHLPPQAKIASGEQVCKVTMNPGSPLTLSLVQSRHLSQHKAMALVLTLTVPASTQPGPAQVGGVVEVAVQDGPPLKAPFNLTVEVLPAGAKAKLVSPEMLASLSQKQAPPAAQTPPPPPASPAEQDPMAGKSLWWILLGVFAGGLGLNLTPCVYPLIPITVSFFGGRSQGNRGALLRDSLAYWAGLAIMYTLLGAFVALSGRMLGEALTHPLVIVFLTLVMLALASSMFGLWELRMPAALNRMAAANRSGVVGTLLMGLTVGILAAPCVGPFVVGLMTHVAKVGRVDYGLLVFFTLSLGLGLPLAVLAFFSGSITRLPGAGDWMVWVRKFFGVVLLLMAIFVARPLMGEEVFRWLMALVGAAGGVYLGLFEASGQGRFRLLKRLVGLVLVVTAGVFLWVTAPPPDAGKIAWQPYSQENLDKALAAGKPILVYVTADWCPPCRQLKANTWPDARVRAAMAGFTGLEVDVTSGVTAQVQPLMQKWRVRGVPTQVFLDSKGRHIPEVTIVGFVPPESELKSLDRALALSRAAEGKVQ